MYNPVNWVILKITTSTTFDDQLQSEPETIYKVFASFDNAAWRMNSGINKVEETDEEYIVYGWSGSCYRLAKGAEGTNFYTQQVLTNFMKSVKDSASIEECTIKECIEALGR